MKKIAFLLFVVCLSSVSFGQNKQKEVLFTIDNHPYYTDEFIRVYNKNLDLVKDDSQKDLDHYLDLFVGYKLKVEKAKKLGLQNDAKYTNELGSYRKQLAKNYVNDSKVTNALIDEAYARTKEEVRASHILVLVSEGAEPKDTLKAYHKMLDLKKRIDAGENFEAVAQKFSEDPSAKENKGDLGYFSAFKMVYPFESAAYNTPVGKISKIFRTRFGYHILKVTDKRLNRGEVTVEHIMLLNPSVPSSEANTAVKKAIDDIYQKIKQGENFEELAKQFSEDKSTAAKGGLLQRFGSGQLTSQEFENIAFSLTEKGQISEPFKSKFGWHIVKLVERNPVPPLDEIKYDLENKIKKDDRSLLITNSLAKKLRAKYDIKQNAKLLAQIKNAVTEDFYRGIWEYPSDSKKYNDDLIVINKDRKIEGSAFLTYLQSQQKGNIKTRPLNALVDELYQKWVDDQLIIYFNDNLENEFPEFSYVMDEYRDGLLLFDLMEKEIWEKAKTDTLGLEKFYNSHVKDYMWKTRYDVDIYSSTEEKAAKKAQSYCKKGKSIEYIKEKLNKDGKVNIMVKSGVFEEDFDVLQELAIKTTGATKIVQKGSYYFVADVKEIKAETPKTINECKGKLTSDYQQYLENNWVTELKKEFDVKIDNTVFEKVKAQIRK
ncbi:peptidylprolyl isomerase [Flavobacterium sediminis]|uniref:Peptidylprolyl isomerase n=1 Tax=Flavobacterium sediminis TaxID=2201181 RepID=A0A2U8QRZ3_9FLAO|nr:peptidylprolyl isomerase [Flavobacterium sediminis]AWM12918.1 peptidylprolyl isomerase [Flavobacterium sediminis]